MSSKIVKGEKLTLPPLPRTSRGFGIHIDGTVSNNKRLIYTNGRFVIIRSLENEFEATLFSGHKCNVNVAKFSPNGNWVASGDCEGNVIIWGVTNKIIKNSVRANMGVLDISWGADNSQVAAVGNGSNGFFARVFRMDSSNSIGEISAHSKKILACALKPSRPLYLATCSEDMAVNFYKGVPFHHEKTHRIHKNFPNCIRYTKSGDKVAVVSSDKKIVFFSGEGVLLDTIEPTAPGAHKGSIYSCSFSPDGKKLLTASGDKTVKVWDVGSLSCEKTFKAGDAVLDMQVACLWLEGFVLSVSLSGAINFWNLERFEESGAEHVWNGHQEGICSVASIAEKETIYSSDKSGKIVEWNLKAKSTKELGKGIHHGKPVNKIALNLSGDRLLSAGFDNRLVLTETEDGSSSEICSLNGQPKSLSLGAKSESLVVVATANKTLCVKNIDESGCNSVELPFKPTCGALSPNEDLYAVGGENKEVHIFDVDGTSFTEKSIIKKHKSDITFVGFSEEGGHLITASRDSKIYVWNIQEGFEKPLNTRGWAFHSSKVSSACAQKDFAKVATGALDESIIIWSDPSKGNTAKRKPISPAHLGGVNTLDVYDSNSFLSSGEDKCIRLWDF